MFIISSLFSISHRLIKALRDVCHVIFSPFSKHRLKDLLRILAREQQGGQFMEVVIEYINHIVHGLCIEPSVDSGSHIYDICPKPCRGMAKPDNPFVSSGCERLRCFWVVFNRIIMHLLMISYKDFSRCHSAVINDVLKEVLF
jgi:hypothetical protein